MAAPALLFPVTPTLKQAAILKAALQLLNQLIEFYETLYEIMPLNVTQNPYTLKFLSLSPIRTWVMRVIVRQEDTIVGYICVFK